MERRFFLKYGDYRRGLCLVIVHDPFTTIRIDYDVEPGESDERFHGIGGVIKLQKRLRELYPDPYSVKDVPQGDVYFADILYSLNESVGRRYRRRAAALKRLGRGK